jgi:hypothetical protein
MEQDFDEWRPWARKAWSSVGRRHPVVLRDLERFDDDELRQYLRSRWDRFTAEAASDGLPMALACNDEADQGMLEGWIESEPSLAALVLASSLRNPSSGAMLEVALASGVPVVLWRRSDLRDCSTARTPDAPPVSRAAVPAVKTPSPAPPRRFSPACAPMWRSPRRRSGPSGCRS